MTNVVFIGDGPTKTKITCNKNFVDGIQTFKTATVVFQNCKMVIRKPLDNQQCIVTAQGWTTPDSSGATILQNCTITADPAYYPVRNQNKAYLGRPWKPYSRTIVMQSFIDDSIAPEGWTPWAGTIGLDTLFYAEHGNRGPGTAQTNREYTPGKFFTSADAWIPSTGCPYTPNMAPIYYSRMNSHYSSADVYRSGD
ncbi:putative pectinesterase/pectinesterase inhibitor 23 [Drosera capensis]